jgi:TatD DNase family protein
MQFIDSHSHIDFTEFDADRPQVIARAIETGVSDIIVSSTTAIRWPLVKKVVLDNPPHCHAAYGLHPMFMQKHDSAHLDQLKHWLINNNAVAVGEIGLDFFIHEIGENDKAVQIEIFVGQLEIAKEYNLPVIIHARKSLDIVLKYLRQFPGLCGSIHSFSGSAQQAKQLIELGFYLGFGGPVTYSRATRLRKLLVDLPLDALLLETDSPDQPDALHHGKRNEPAYLINIATDIAKLRGIELAKLASITTHNAKKLFKI